MPGTGPLRLVLLPLALAPLAVACSSSPWTGADLDNGPGEVEAPDGFGDSPDLPDTSAACEGLPDDPAAMEFDLDCAGEDGCVARDAAAGCACRLCHAGRCLRLTDACGNRPAVEEATVSIALADACMDAGGPLTMRMTAASQLPDRGLLLGGSVQAPAFPDGTGRVVYAYFPENLAFGWSHAGPLFSSPRVTAILPVDERTYLVARTVPAETGTQWHLEGGIYGRMFEESWGVDIPDGWAVADLNPGASGDIRVVLTAEGGDGWRLQSLVPHFGGATLGAVVDEAAGRPPARVLETNTGRMRVAAGLADAYSVAGRDRAGTTLWTVPGDAPGTGTTRALARAAAGGVWAAGERFTAKGSTGSVDRVDAQGQVAARHVLAFGTDHLPFRAWPAALLATADGGVIVAAGATAQGGDTSAWSGTLLRRLGPDGAMAWERRYTGWEPLALVRSLDQVRLVVTRASGECHLAVLGVAFDDPGPACWPDCPAQSCGDDGCGGNCGPCAPERTCEAGGCFRSDAVAYPPDPATSGFATVGCDTNWSLRVIDWADRPSSGRTCYLPPTEGESPEKGTRLPCLPWETCDAGDTWFPGTDQHFMAGTLRCGRSCGTGVPCPFGTECRITGLPYTDYLPPDPTRLCAAPAPDTTWPTDPLGGPAAAEGGLGCWTTIAEVTGRNSGSRITVVGAHVYALAWQAGWKGDGTSVTGHRLQHSPLEPGVPATGVTVVAEAAEIDGAHSIWTWLRESDGRLLAFERPVPAAPEGWAGAIEHEVLWGEPAADGAIALSPSGVKVTLVNDEAAPVPGARHGCLVRLADDGDLVLVCFPVQGSTLTMTETPLSIPHAVRQYLVWYQENYLALPFHGRPSFLAASDRWLVAVTGDPCQRDGSVWQIHAAPFDPEAAHITGGWASWPLPAGILPECQGAGSILAYRDTVLVGGLSTRLTGAGPGPWLATTPRMAGYPMDWTVAGDLVVSLDLLELTGPDPLPGRITANRVLW